MKTDVYKGSLFIAVALIYTVDTIVRFYGLGSTAFWASGWNRFDLAISIGSLATTVISQIKDNVGTTMLQAQKVFMVVIVFKLVQRLDSLNKLFKTVR
jgi:hypothetical protein